VSAPRKALLLDFGGVISVTLFEQHRRTEKILGLAEGALTWRGPFDPTGDTLWMEMLEGRISEREYWARRAAEVGRMLGEDWTMPMMTRYTAGDDPNSNIRKEAMATVDRAKRAGHKVGILSNELELFHGRAEMDALEILRMVDSLVDATHTHILKPDPRAYALGCEALEMSPEQIVFLDDQMRNIEGANRFGLDAVWFDVRRPAESFAEAERRLGLI